MATPHERETQLADDYLASAILARNVAHKALERTQQELEAGTLRDPGKAAVNAATAGGIMLDKRLILEGRPTQIHALEDPVQAGIALLKRHNITIDGTATEIPTTEVQEPKPQGRLKRSNHARPGAIAEALGDDRETQTHQPLLSEGESAKRASASN